MSQLKMAIDGVLLLDKPSGFSSNQCLQQVKHVFGAKKAGHTGTLDPLATGMLPICFGEATKFSRFLLESHKSYRVRCRLGITTSTADACGEVLQRRPVPSYDQATLLEALAQFKGTIWQQPPMYSALKHQGERLYNLARAGEVVERPKREVTLSSIELLSHQDDFVDFEVTCSKGTYVRSLVEDLGEVLGCGAHVEQLRRLTVGHFLAEDMVDLASLKADRTALLQHLQPVQTLLQAWPEITVSSSDFNKLSKGQAVEAATQTETTWVKIMAADVGFIGIGEHKAEGSLLPKRLLSMMGELERQGDSR